MNDKRQPSLEGFFGQGKQCNDETAEEPENAKKKKGAFMRKYNES